MHSALNTFLKTGHICRDVTTQVSAATCDASTGQHLSGLCTSELQTAGTMQYLQVYLTILWMYAGWGATRVWANSTARHGPSSGETKPGSSCRQPCCQWHSGSSRSRSERGSFARIRPSWHPAARCVFFLCIPARACKVHERAGLAFAGVCAQLCIGGLRLQHHRLHLVVFA